MTAGLLTNTHIHRLHHTTSAQPLGLRTRR